MEASFEGKLFFEPAVAITRNHAVSPGVKPVSVDFDFVPAQTWLQVPPVLFDSMMKTTEFGLPLRFHFRFTLLLMPFGVAMRSVATFGFTGVRPSSGTVMPSCARISSVIAGLR